ncbi:MAG: AMP-binding protein [Burkholderiaceae bacterium]|nr:AMP-binding protein [Sulfuritalea sp.]MCF8174723.1 AMP-binding protein [Burkholderiaceae bacterium]
MTSIGLDESARDWDSLRASFRWQVPQRYNIAQACCGRWADDRSRFALYYEDESGHTEAWTFWDIQQAANRLSNVLGAMGVMAGDRVAIILPQRPETGIAHMACYQMGAIAVPVSHLFGADALEFRLSHAEVRVAIVDDGGLEKLAAARAALPDLKHVIGVGGARESWVREWETLLPLASSRYTARDTAADDAAMIIYTSGTTGNPKGALIAQRSLLGNLPGFVCSHDFYPRRGDMFWSPADWAWTGGLFDALLPSWNFGQPLLGYRGRFDPEKAFWLMEKYSVRNSFLFPTALKMMMKAVPRPKENYDLALRSIMSAGETVGEAVCGWAQEALGVTVNEMYGQTEINYIVGNCAAVTPPKPGAMGRGYPGHHLAVLDDEGQPVAAGELGEVCVRRSCDGIMDPVFMLGYWKNPQATAEKFFGGGIDDPKAWGRTGDLAKLDEDGALWYQGRSDDMFKSAGYRIGPGEIENCLVKHPAVANAAVIGEPDATRGTVVKAFIVLQAGETPSPELEASLQQHVRQFLAPYEYPKIIEFIDALPMTTTGKVQRRLLRQRGGAGA